MSQTIETVTAHVIPWEGSRGVWGVSIDLLNNQSISYEVGDKALAEIECRSVADGNPPQWGPWEGMILIEKH
jgi:hypothetical protein